MILSDIMSVDANKPLQSWTCVKCGAALPAEAATGELVTCGYCGTPFSLPTATTRCGGISISGGSVTIGGDLIGGSKRVIATSEAPSAATIWDEPDTDDSEGVSIEGEGIQVHGDVVGGSVVKIIPPAVQVEPVVTATPEVVAPAKIVEPKTAPASMPQLHWWDKIKRLFSN
jgi:hypothetical protein